MIILPLTCIEWRVQQFYFLILEINGANLLYKIFQQILKGLIGKLIEYIYLVVVTLILTNLIIYLVTRLSHTKVTFF